VRVSEAWEDGTLLCARLPVVVRSGRVRVAGAAARLSRSGVSVGAVSGTTGDARAMSARRVARFGLRLIGVDLFSRLIVR
jgi:hypothetical protein